MENWGLVTYRTTAVLFDEYASDQKYRNRVVYVVAHELAHQWFGNLVTMDWWSELWLNEGKLPYISLPHSPANDNRLCYMGWLVRCGSSPP